ncbi:MAG: hypothetical protein RLZ39_1145 [Bacteroidota bacterium]|jgi:gliding motility-associated lipoprotein GldD
MRLPKIFFFFIVLGISCNQPYAIKPKGYQQIDLPEKQYQIFSETGYPYSFEYPVYATIDKQVSYLGNDKSKDAWLNIRYPQFGATLYVSYNKINARVKIDTLVRDTYTFANNHNSRANFIEDSAFEINQNVKGVFFHIGGDVATSYQFFATDSTKHFLRAALYFETTPNEDSLAPINQYLFKDMQHMVRSLRWK